MTTTTTTTTTCSGWDVPPFIYSSSTNLNKEKSNNKQNTTGEREWKTRTTKWKTSQRIATLVVTDNDNDTTSSIDTTPTTITCHPILIHSQYLLVSSTTTTTTTTRDGSRSTSTISLFSIAVDYQTSISLSSSSSSSSLSNTKSKTTTTTTTPFWKPTKPIVQLSLEEEEFMIVQLFEVPTTITTTKKKKEKEDNPYHAYIFALTEQGKLYLLSFVSSSPSSSSSTTTTATTANTNLSPSLTRVATWKTGIYGATCMTVLEQPSIQIQTTTTTTIQQQQQEQCYNIMIGYQSGQMECWKLTTKHTTTTIKQNKKWKFELQWRGIMQEEGPIRSMTVLQQEPKNKYTTTTTTTATMEDILQQEQQHEQEPEQQCSLVVTMQGTTLEEAESNGWSGNNHNHSLDVSSMVQILNLNLDSMKKEYGAAAAAASDIPLHYYQQMPTYGMGFVDSSSLSNLPKRIQVLPSRGTDCSISLLGGKKCGVALSNGMVAILSSGTEQQQQRDNHFSFPSSWGIVKDKHQMVLSYPAIGCGQIKDNGRDYLVCCLRAGTCFLLPLGTKKTNNDILAIPYPHDVDTDLASVYIQGFTAGEIELAQTTTTTTTSDLSSSPSTLSILAFALAGGVIDIYACGLIYPKNMVEEDKKE